MAIELYPLRFEPIFKHAIWGGRSLRPLFGMAEPAEPEGEAWVLSDQGNNLSRVVEGPLKGKTLRDLMIADPRSLVGDAATPQGRFPLLLKFLDARQPLSVQVHPNDEQAQLLESTAYGKTEAWVILNADPGSLLYSGLRAGVDMPQFREALTGGTLPDVMHTVVAEPGDCLFLEAGTIHAIGSGLMLFEVQQTSDITYRLYDWGRVDAKTGLPRALHIEPALMCTNVERGPCDPVTPVPLDDGRERLVACRYFTLERKQGETPFPVGTIGGCRIVVCVAGRAVVQHGQSNYPMRVGEILLLPAAVGKCLCVPDGNATILECGVV